MCMMCLGGMGTLKQIRQQAARCTKRRCSGTAMQGQHVQAGRDASKLRVMQSAWREPDVGSSWQCSCAGMHTLEIFISGAGKRSAIVYIYVEIR